MYFCATKVQKTWGLPKCPHTPQRPTGGALREPRAKQSNGFLAYSLPSAARRRTPARCCARFLAYAPAIKSPARYRAGRSKQHNPARNVKPFPPRGSPRGTPRGQEGVKGDTCLSPSPFSLPFGKKRKKPRPSMRRSLNAHRTPPLLSAYPKFSFLSQPLLLLCPAFLLSPCFSFLLSVPPHKKEPAGPFLWLPAPCMGPA